MRVPGRSAITPRKMSRKAQHLHSSSLAPVLLTRTHMTMEPIRMDSVMLVLSIAVLGHNAQLRLDSMGRGI